MTRVSIVRWNPKDVGRQISGLTNRNHIRLQLRIRLPNKPKSNNYSELAVVNVADRWRGRLRSYLGRSHGHGKGDIIFAFMVEIRFVMRSQQRPYSQGS
jgi:hypothetical protein